MSRRTTVSLIASILCLIVGCGRDSGSWMNVTTDAAQLADARKRAAQAEQTAIEKLIPSDSNPIVSVDYEAFPLLKRHREEITKKLKQIIAESKNQDVLTSAATVLCGMQVAEGRAAAVKVLKEGSLEVQKRMLDALDYGIFSVDPDDDQSQRKFLLEDPALVDAILAQLDAKDPMLLKSAIQTCGLIDLPGARERFMKLLDNPHTTDKDRLLFWLSKGPLSKELLEKTQRIQAETQLTADSNMSVFEAFAESTDPELRQAGREELKKWLAKFPDKNELSFRGDRLSVLRTLGKTSTAKDLPWLREAQKTEHGLYAQKLLAAQIRLEGAAGKAHLKKLLADPQQLAMAVDLAGEIFAGTGDAEIIADLNEAGKQAKPPEVATVCQALLQVGGDQAKAAVREFIPRLNVDLRPQFQQQLDEVSLDDLKQRLIAANLLEESTVTAALKKIAKRDKTTEMSPPGLLDVLTEAGNVVIFDAETGTLPCRHDQLLDQFTQHSHGVFKPEAASEEWHQKNQDDVEADYTLRFIHNGKLYSGRLRNQGDWYDVERVVTMINSALKDAGRVEEFIPMSTRDQIATFIFADRKVLEPIAAEYHLPLSQNLNQSMETGKEFEKKVLKELKVGGN